MSGNDGHGGGRGMDACVVLALGGLYLATAARTVAGGDSAEFVAVASQWGVAHPPGYPLYTLYLGVMRWLPAVSPAHAASLATAILGLLTVPVLLRAMRAWGAPRTAATIATALFATSSVSWTFATHPEVFALNNLLAAGMVGLSAPDAGWRGTRRLLGLGLLAGLGLSNHHSIVLLAPVGLYGAVRGLRESTTAGRDAVLGWCAFAVGLLPYAYLVVAARCAEPLTWTWGDTGSAAGLLHHVLRQDYGTFDLAIGEDDGVALEHVGLLAWNLSRWTLHVPALLGVAGLVAGCARRTVTTGGVPWRPAWWMLTASLVTAGPLFVSRFNLAAHGWNGVIVEKFHGLPLLMFSVFVAHGLGLCGRWVLERLPGLRPATLLRSVLVVSALSLGASGAWRQVAAEHTRAVEAYLRNCLASLPHGAVLFGQGDHRVFGFLYLQDVVGVRTDVAYVDAVALPYPWYLRRVSHLLRLQHDVESEDTSGLVRALLEEKRRVFLATPEDDVQRDFVLLPHGPVLEVFPRGVPLPDPRLVYRDNVELFAHLDFDYAPPTARDTWPGEVHETYARSWDAIAARLRAVGEDTAARQAAEMAESFAPWRDN